MAKKLIEHSFVILAYKDSFYLEECIVSLKNQTYPSVIMITTSTPSDFIRNMANKYQLELLVNNHSSGIAGDWNFGLAVAKTSWVTLAHQDDVYEHNFLEKLNAHIDLNFNTLIAFTDYEELLEGKKRSNTINLKIKKLLLLPYLFKSRIETKWIRKLLLRFGNSICCPSVSFNKEALGDFIFSEEYTYILDWKAWFELADCDGAFLYIPDKLMSHRIHKDSETTIQLKTNNRREEEKRFLISVWGQWFGSMLAWIYQKGHKDNVI